MGTVNWLHLTDLHLGMKEQGAILPGVKDILWDDLDRIHKICGPWDLVLFTGDLVQSGEKAEYRNVDLFLDEMFTRLNRIGSKPKLLTVPGNHDLKRPNPDLPEVEVLQDWTRKERLRTQFWEVNDSPYRRVVSEVFANYTEWANDRVFGSKDILFQAGILPGDFSTTLTMVSGQRVGIIGLNSTFLQLTGGDYQKRLAIHPKQFHAVCNGDGPQWVAQHDICILMTHHPLDWLSRESRDQFFSEIAVPGRFVAHLFGHMHEAEMITSSHAGAAQRRLLQGTSLFGLERYVDEKNQSSVRRHGYAAGRITIEDGQGVVRLWPRAAHRHQAGHLQIIPDPTFQLESDQGTPGEIFNLSTKAHEATSRGPQAKRKASSAIALEAAAAGLPRPPHPFLAHPYPIQRNFTGRSSYRSILTSWIGTTKHPVLVVEAIGGMGKSALTWAWLMHDVLGEKIEGFTEDLALTNTNQCVESSKRPEGIIWWSFYEREAHFEAFVRHALMYLGLTNAVIQDLTERDRVRRLISLLQQKRILLILDGFERELRGYISLSVAYQGDFVPEDFAGDPRITTDSRAGDFLRFCAATGLKSSVLITTRLFPKDLEGKDGRPYAGCRHILLSDLRPNEAVTFFYAQGVKGTTEEIIAACEPYGFHPLALRLLSGVILRDKRLPGDIRVAEQYPVLPDLKGKEQHHILQVSYETLAPDRRLLLSQIAAFRGPVTSDVAEVFNCYPSRRDFSLALDDLIERGLIFFSNTTVIDLHPIVRQYAYDRLTDKLGAHTRLLDYFSALQTPNTLDIKNIQDLTTVIDLYHHTAHAGYYDFAYGLYRDRLGQLLFQRFASYQQCISLLGLLFPEGEDRVPSIANTEGQIWVLNAISSAYLRAGNLRQALRRTTLALVLAKESPINKHHAFCLLNIANIQGALGELKEAEISYRKCIQITHDLGNNFQESVAHRDLARVLMRRGSYCESYEELDRAIVLLSDSKKTRALGVIWACRAQHALIMRQSKYAIMASRRFESINEEVSRTYQPHEADYVWCGLLTGASIVTQIEEDGSHSDKNLLHEAESRLSEALSRGRTVNLIETEPEVLLALARCFRLSGNLTLAKDYATQALSLADRCGFRLHNADAHLLLAKLELQLNDSGESLTHAQIASKLATCDGYPHSYLSTFQAAETLISNLTANSKASSIPRRARRAKGSGSPKPSVSPNEQNNLPSDTTGPS